MLLYQGQYLQWLERLDHPMMVMDKMVKVMVQMPGAGGDVAVVEGPEASETPQCSGEEAAALADNGKCLK